MIHVDLHVHSSASNKAAGFFSQKLGIKECYNDPKSVYRLLRERGMSLVTLTDHDTIDGALEIAHLPGAFVSEEVTTYFPEDRCKVHVLVLDIDEATHRDLQELRGNIYELVDYCVARNLTHVLAHPLYDQDGRLNASHIERFLLLFDNWEILNGTRSKMSARLTVEIARAYRGERLAKLADKWGFNRRRREQIAFTGGSDDHGGFDPGTAYTVAAGESVADLKAAIAAGETTFGGAYGCPQRLSHTIMKVVYNGVRDRFGVQHDVLDAIFDPRLIDHGDRRVVPLSRGHADLKRSTGAGLEQLRRAPHDTIRAYFGTQAGELVDALKTMVLSGTRSNATADTLVGLMPTLFYTSVYWHRALEKQVSRKLHRELVSDADAAGNKVAFFTDTIDEINGVAKTCRNLLDLAIKRDLDVQFFLCGTTQPNSDHVVQLAPAFTMPLPEYPEIVLKLPRFRELLAQVEQGNYDVIYTATPGPMGLAALALSYILRLPLVSTFHTDFAAYAKAYTGDHLFAEHVARLMAWFYNRCDRVLVPSHEAADTLAAYGVERAKMDVFQRGVDVRAFNPAHARSDFWQRWAPDYQGEPVVLFVGRVAAEKNIDRFIAAVRAYRRTRNVPAIRFAIVGDGPKRAELEATYGDRIIFTGYLEGAELAAAYASADVFLFPSATETFGNVVLEAQASGLIPIVSNQGAAHENIIPGQTGFVVERADGRDWLQPVLDLVADRDRMAAMRTAAVHFARSRDQQALFAAMLDKIALGRLRSRPALADLEPAQA